MLLSKRTQAGIIAALLRGEKPVFNPDDLTGVYREYHDWISGRLQDPTDLWLHFNNAFAREDDHLPSIKLVAALHDDPIAYPNAREVLDQLPDLRWLWPGWIPRGQITMVMGDPSAGKSYFTLDLAQRIAAGTTFPDGQHIERPGTVLYIDAENKPSMFKKRVQPWPDHQASRLYYMLPTPNMMMIDLDQDLDRERLLDRIYHIRPELIIIDSYSSISLKGENNKEDVQRILSFMTRIARDYDCAVVIIHHLKKPQHAQMTLPAIRQLDLARLRGSGHLGAMPTNVLGMTLIGSDKNGPRNLHVVKNNLGKYPEPIGVTFKEWDQDPEVAILEYGEVPNVDEANSLVDKCTIWLNDLLEEMGPLPSSEIIEMGDEEGFNRRMIYRARKRLGDEIVDTHTSHHPDNRWALVDDVDEDDDLEDE